MHFSIYSLKFIFFYLLVSFALASFVYKINSNEIVEEPTPSLMVDFNDFVTKQVGQAYTTENLEIIIEENEKKEAERIIIELKKLKEIQQTQQES
jgi:hypothetical protein